ncbi:MAG: hypothetical protein ACETWR_12580 [Anaerolineae bacterium]
MELGVDQRDLLIERLAQKVSRWGLTAPAILFLEANKPFSFIMSQALLFFQPLLGFLLGDEVIGGYAQLFEDQASVERLLQLLEQH